MNIHHLEAISPIDGRYINSTKELSAYFSESALFKFRTLVEIEYLIKLLDTQLFTQEPLNLEQKEKLKEIVNHFSIEDTQQIKSIEKVTNHDVKAVEYFIKEKLEVLGLSPYRELVHFGLTSQDINNTAIPISLKKCWDELFSMHCENLIEQINSLSKNHTELAMLARTHGQPATPTTLGKELEVFVERLQKQLRFINSITLKGKFGGATGSFNAHFAAFPNFDWHSFANQLLSELGLNRNYPTTQIDHYDELSNFLNANKQFCIILIDFCRDIWHYISINYFTQKINPKEVGSSAMPHKVNPIDFENAEGNLGIAIALFDFISNKLPISRLQRDLTDSTVLRNIGVPFAHFLIAIKSIQKGISKLVVNEKALTQDLKDNFSVIAEAIQTILRRENYPNPYEALKDFSRGKGELKEDDFIEFINTLNINKNIKEELLQIKPFNYLGK
jgi:adenylosuccinate lyase